MTSHWQIAESPDEVWSLPESRGVYVIYGDREILYIGKASNLRLRLTRGHGIDWARYSTTCVSRFGRYTTLSVKYKLTPIIGEMDWIETRLIYRLRPQFNIRGIERA